MNNPLKVIVNGKRVSVAAQVGVYAAFYMVMLLLINACLSYAGDLVTAKSDIAVLCGGLVYIIAILFVVLVIEVTGALGYEIIEWLADKIKK